MKTNRLILPVLVMALLILASCGKATPSDQGNIILTVDWTARGEKTPIPERYFVEVNNQTLLLHGTRNVLPQLRPGSYCLLVHNDADRINVFDATAMVDTRSGIIDPCPDWFFTSSVEVNALANAQKTCTAVMIQQVRELLFQFTLTQGDPESITGASVSLTGLANGLNLETGEVIPALVSPNRVIPWVDKEVPGNPSTRQADIQTAKVVSPLTRQGNQFTGTVRLLGVIPSAQQLLGLTLTFWDGTQQTLTQDLEGRLNEFNTDKHSPITLETDIRLSPEAGVASKSTLPAPLRATFTPCEVITGQ